MLTFQLLTDETRIRETITHPRIWPWVVDDGTPSRVGFRPVMGNDAIRYVGAFEGEEYLGLWQFTKRNAVTWEVHTCLLPNGWGSRAVEACQQVAKWFWASVPSAERIVTCIPADNTLALRLATASGMKQWGRNPRAFSRGGKLLDEVWLGLSRFEEETCQ